MAQFEYMKALWDIFYGTPSEAPEADRLRRRLGKQLPKNQRKQLLRLVDAMNQHCGDVSLDSFVAGFRLAAGIAREISCSGFSFLDFDEERAKMAFEAERKVEAKSYEPKKVNNPAHVSTSRII